ncbi:MAG: 30S ribosomal protein S5 [Halobacteriovoraceae bacterium]|nr:30S ribosomal protein S5 [Halobacteriovoraceae bacterium]|tara:strand:- start:23932 stop:24531 length:600 start_codon:yes stop_codon:yes gene_type:complete
MSTENNNPQEEKAQATEKKAPSKRAPRARKQAEQTTAPDVEERVVAVNRVAKVVKGGRRFSFSALVIVGDQKGKVGYGLGKAKEVPDAIRKASQVAAKSMIYVPVEKGTLPHEVLGEFDAGKILFRPASEGTGIKAAGACRTILELAGVKNVLTKSMRGNNPHNVVKATFAALKNIRSVDQVAKARGVDPKSLRISSHK